MSNVPEARALVLKVANEMEGRAEMSGWRIALLAAHKLMTREKMAKPRAKARRTCTKEVADAIRSHMKRNPTAQILDVAVKFGVGTGRVSEIINGKR